MEKVVIGNATLYRGDCREILKQMPDKSVQCCITSPPYFGLRDYGVDGQIGLEQTPESYVAELVAVFREVWRVLKNDGTVWLNLGDSYNAHPCQRKTTDKSGEKQQSVRGSTATPSRHVDGLKPKDLIGIPWRVALALQADGWYLRQDIIWSKPNPMPESVTDRCTKSHEYIFLLSKSERYFYDQEAIRERTLRFGDVPGGKKYSSDQAKAVIGENHNAATLHGCPVAETRNRRSVWTVSTKPFSEAHFATFPEDLILPCILAGSRPGDTVLDPFNGAGTTGLVALKHDRKYIGIELNPDYITIACRRIEQAQQQLRLPLEAA